MNDTISGAETRYVFVPAYLKQSWEPAGINWVYSIDSQYVGLSLRPAEAALLLGRSQIPFFIYMDGQDIQDFSARVSTVLRSTIAQASTRIPKPASKLMEHREHEADH